MHESTSSLNFNNTSNPLLVQLWRFKKKGLSRSYAGRWKNAVKRSSITPRIQAERFVDLIFHSGNFTLEGVVEEFDDR